MRMRKYMSGITLIELMIVVLILSLLVAVGYPNYQEFAARAKRNEAKAMLMEIAVNQERFYLQNNRYGTLGDLGYDDPWESETGSYMVTIGPPAPDSSNFTARANYQFGGNEATKCLNFFIDGRGSKTSDPDGDCWTRTR